jgi:hypothetical protein
MTMSRLNPLFHRPGPMGIGVQKCLVMVCLDDEGVHFAQSLNQHFRRETEIGDEPHVAGTGLKHESNRIDRVVRHRKSLDKNIANRKFRTRPKNSPVPMAIQGTVAADRFCGKRIPINRDLKFAAKNFQPANMIAMLVRKQNAVEVFRRDSALLEPKNNLPCAQSTIDQNLAMIRRDKRAVSGAAAAEHPQTEHVGI